MKKTHCWPIAVIILPLLLITLPSQKAQAQDAAVSYQSDGVSYQTFYDQLAPYGQWVGDPQYGNVWVPNVPPGFRPYASDGHWVMTDQGNMWVSDAPWAWAAYHYGRWTYNGYYGWIWIPGYQWAPAWVSWRSGGGYYGWAPMGPGHEYGRNYDYPDNYWVFVTPDYLYHPYVYNYYAQGNSYEYMHRTEYVHYEERGRDPNHYYYGPRREDIERETHRPIDVYRVSDAREAGAGGQGAHEVNIYRPAVNRESEHSARPANIVEGRDHPIGRPEAISPDHEHRQPAFREEHHEQQRDVQSQQREQQYQQQHQQFQQQEQHQQQPVQHQQQYQQQPTPHQQQYQQQQQQHQQPPAQQSQPQQQSPHQQYQQQQQRQQQPAQQSQQHQQQPKQQHQRPQQQPKEEQHK